MSCVMNTIMAEELGLPVLFWSLKEFDSLIRIGLGLVSVNQ